MLEGFCLHDKPEGLFSFVVKKRASRQTERMFTPQTVVVVVRGLGGRDNMIANKKSNICFELGVFEAMEPCQAIREVGRGSSLVHSSFWAKRAINYSYFCRIALNGRFIYGHAYGTGKATVRKVRRI